MIDWYCRKTWTESDEEEFYKKLNRAHKSNRSQYLKVQAIELIATNDLKLIEVAEKLLLKILSEYYNDRIFISQTYNSLGNIYEIKNDFEIALMYYKKSLDFEKEFPNVITTSILDYSKLVIKLERYNLYDDVEILLQKKIEKNPFMFPIESYIIYSILATIAFNKHEDEKGKIYLKIAEENASKKNNSLWNTKKNKIGIVNKRLTWLDKLLKK